MRDPRESAQRRRNPRSAAASGAEVTRSPGEAPRGRSEASADGDHELIRLAQGGDERSFELLVKRYEERAWRVARNMLPNDEDARDLVQEAFLRVFRGLDRFDFQHEFGTWLYRIVTNLAIDQLRRRRPTVSTRASGQDDEGGEMELADERVSAPSERLEALETARRVRVCLTSLAVHFQSVLVLREIEGLGCPEIAGIVGATHVTVRWRLHRGRKLFLEEWERRERLAERADPTAWTQAREIPKDDPNSAVEPSVDDLEASSETS